MEDRISGRLQHRHETCCEKGSRRGRQACMVRRWHHRGDVVFQIGGTCIWHYVTTLICLYLYKYLSLWNIPYIIGNGLMSTFQHKFNHANLSSYLWDISKQRFYSYWWSDILVVCCCFYTSCICTDSPHLELYEAT